MTSSEPRSGALQSAEDRRDTGRRGRKGVGEAQTLSLVPFSTSGLLKFFLQSGCFNF